MKLNHHTHIKGSVLVWTVLTMIILSLFATEVLRAVSGRYQLGIQAAKWQEALLAAESGVDLAVVELRKSLYPAPNNLGKIGPSSRRWCGQSRPDDCSNTGTRGHAYDD